MKKLLILIGGHLATAPRAQKEAAAAVEAGFNVQIRGTWLDDRLAAEDIELSSEIGAEFAPVIDLRPGHPGRAMIRLRQRFAREVFLRCGLPTSRAFGTGAPEYLKTALRIRADLTMVHSEAGLWVGMHLLSRGCRVGVDFEDWFSQDLRPEDRRGRPVIALQRLERRLLERANLTITTTGVMAEAMRQDAEVARTPLVIPNCFPWRKAPTADSEPTDRRDAAALSLYWFSQTIGPGRGLETLAEALSGLRGNWQLHLRGELRSHAVWFDSVFPPSTRSRIVLHPTVSNYDLASHSASHDVGLALEEPYTLSRDLTATNKIFEYLRCGLAVVATATRGQREVLKPCMKAGWLVDPGNATMLKTKLQLLIDSPEHVSAAKAAARDAAEVFWDWDRFKPSLQAALDRAART